MNQAKETESLVLNWDLSNSRTVKDVGWIDDNKEDFYSKEGDILLTLKLPQNKEFKESLNRFYVDRKGDTVTNLNLHLPAMTLDEAYNKAKTLINYWNLDSKDIDEWYKKQQSGKPENHATFATFRNDLSPATGIEIMNSFNDAKPWYISFKVSFDSPK